jgi:transposase-like protein
MEWTATAKKWQKIFQDYERGGLRRKEFCEAKGVKLSTFDYWRARLRKTTAEVPAVVKVATVKRPAEPIRIRVNEQIVVELDGDAGEDQLKRVLKAAAQA